MAVVEIIDSDLGMWGLEEVVHTRISGHDIASWGIFFLGVPKMSLSLPTHPY